MSFRLRVGNHECQHCLKGYRGDYEFLTHYTDDFEKNPEAVADCEAGIAPCVEHQCYSANAVASRTNESEFRTNVPRRVGRAEILEVRDYKRGGAGSYAHATALCKWGDKDYSVHTLIHDADRIGTHGEWVLEGGHYCTTRERANRILAGDVLAADR